MKFLLIATVLFAAALSPVAADPASTRALLTQRRELGFLMDAVKDGMKTVKDVAGSVDLPKDSEDWKKALGSMNDLMKDAVKDATKAFDDCDECKKLGANADAVGKKLLAEAAKGGADLDKMLTKFTGKNLKGFAKNLAADLENGAKIGKADAEKLLKKLKDSDGFGDVKTWTGAAFSQMGQLLEGIKGSDIAKFTKEAIQGGMAEIKKTGAKLGAFTKAQVAAWKPKIEEAYGKAKNMLSATIAELGAMAGTIDLSELKLAAVKGLKGAAIKLKGGAEFAKESAAWTKEKLTELTAEAKKAFNGKTLRDFRANVGGKVSDIAEKIKALVCPDGKCPGALLDVEVPHGAAETADQIKAKIEAYLKKAKAKAASVVETIQIAATTDAATVQGRRLAASDTAVTTVRLEFDTNSDSTAAAAEVNAADSGVTTSTIPVTATDGTAAAAAVVPTALLSATAVAAALYSLC